MGNGTKKKKGRKKEHQEMQQRIVTKDKHVNHGTWLTSNDDLNDTFHFVSMPCIYSFSYFGEYCVLSLFMTPQVGQRHIPEGHACSAALVKSLSSCGKSHVLARPGVFIAKQMVSNAWSPVQTR